MHEGRSDYVKQKENEHDDEDKGNAAAAVIADAWSHAITAEAEDQNKDEQKN
jgi:hypothetical protein